ncbi:MAG: hypothetical protein KKE23_04495 [Nanoarchaeota archaeon]|nr:hypothetical protein [Nanoarchaeota archaeon]
MSDFNIFSNPRKSRYDPDLARRVNEEKEPVVIKKTIQSPEKPESQSYSPKTSANINLSDYIQIPSRNLLIRKEEELKGETWNDIHFKLAENGLFMPRIDVFMAHFVNVRNSYNGKSELYDGSGKSLSKSETEDLWKYFSTDYRKGCYTWLDALFKEEKGKMTMETNHRVVGKQLRSNTLSLDKYHHEDCFVNLQFNNQGLPTSKSKNQNYEQGENIKFWCPRNGRVAWFYVDSGRAVLDCYYDDPGGRYVGLGVFSCAEGAAQKSK